MQFFEKLMPLCLALFFVRTVFMGYKYLFFLLLVPCAAFIVYALFKQKFVLPNLKRLLLPALVIALFFEHFTPINNVVKESVNILLILYFVVFSKMYYSDDKYDVFLKWIVRLTYFAGGLAVIRMFLSLIGISLPLSRFLFEGERFALVNDNNFYSLFFIISILLSNELLLHRQIDKIEHLIINVVSVINIIANVSRRAYVLYALVMIIMVVIAGFKKYNCRRTLLCNAIMIGFSAVGACVLFCSYNQNMSSVMKQRCYKIYCSFIDNSATYSEFNMRQLRRYYKHNQQQGENINLFYNGDLRYGLKDWDFTKSPHDCIRFKLVGINDNKAISLTRGCSNGYWQVHYKGRPIVYHKGVTYEISFAYRVIAGPATPFYVGWSVDEGQGELHNLPQTIVPIDSVWNRCSVSYKFQEDRINPYTFMNSLQAGSSIEVKDIRMTCDDTTGLPRYVDQLSDSVINKYYSQDTINYFTRTRTDRWRYALELWQTKYDTRQKIFGQGFKYLEWYGEKFYKNPQRYDFPHNPIISSFLYSGVIGGIVYVIFLLMSLWLYWKHREELGVFFMMYLCCMFFSMFSGSSHFSFPLFAFLSFVPFVKAKNEDESKKPICQDNQ